MLDYPLEDVCDLMRHHLDKLRRAPLETDQKYRPPKEKVIYRKAGDDWF